MAVLLEHPNREVVFNACGVIMNVITDCVRQRKAVAAEMIPKLLVIVEYGLCRKDAAALDIDLLLVVCKTLCNLCSEGGTALFRKEDLSNARSLLQRALELPSPEFVEVAKHLLSLI